MGQRRHGVEEMCTGYGDRFEKQYGFFRPVLDEVVEESLRWGELHEGFATALQRGASCLHIPRKRHKNILDRIDDTRYAKNLKKWFPLRSAHISNSATKNVELS